MHWLLSLALAAYVAASPETYYNIQSPRYFPGKNLDDGAVFGFSVSYIPQLKRLVVSAPLADKIGKVFTCDLKDNKNQDCEYVKTNITRYPDTKYDDLNYWLGATVKGADDYFVTCSPLTINEDTAFQPKGIGSYGRCYRYDKAENTLTEFHTLTPSQRKTKYIDIYTKTRTFYDTYEESMDSFGWSIDIFGNIVTIGGPAVISGRVISLNPATNSLNRLIIGKESNISYNFGYSLASGKFLSKKIAHAIGSPYGSYGYGSVTLTTDSLKLATVKIPPGSKVGAMYGAVLCTATLRKAVRDADLLIGSPAYAGEEAYNVGAVFVYIIQNRHAIFKRQIVGTQDGSMFGSAIVSVGDQDNDGIDEIAIAAPYESSGRGTVYLYSGADIMSSRKSIRPIQSLEPPFSCRGFGYSLAALEDYDDNGCNELAIGVPDRNKLVVYNCLASITINLEHFPRTLVNGKVQKLPACFTTTYPQKPEIIDAEIKVEIKIEHPDVKLAGPGDGAFTVLLIRNKNKYCKDINLNLPKEGNYAKEINYKLSAEIIGDKKTRKFKLTDYSETVVSGSIKASECGERDCVPDLKYVKTEFSGNVEKLAQKGHHKFLVGASDVINAQVFIENRGEVAYDACAHVAVEGATVLPSSAGCSIKQSDPIILECRPKQLLRQSNSPWQTQNISLDAASLTNKNKQISFVVSLYDRCGVNSTKEVREEIELINDVNVVVTGQTDQSLDDDMVNLTRSDIAASKTFQHIYTIINNGITTWVDINVHVTTDKQDFVTRHVKIYENGARSCTVESETDKHLVHSCVVDKLKKDAGITIKVLMQVVSDKLNERIANEKLTVRSKILVDLNKTQKEASITSELRLVETRVPWWIIAVSTIIALILLLILVLILRELGFLKRENKEQLKRARQSVRRQTMMRLSAANRPRSSDMNKLVAANEPSTSHKGNVNKKKDRRLVINDF